MKSSSVSIRFTVKLSETALMLRLEGQDCASLKGHLVMSYNHQSNLSRKKKA